MRWDLDMNIAVHESESARSSEFIYERVKLTFTSNFNVLIDDFSVFMQVSHHPPILAFRSESTEGSYNLYGEIEIKNKFWGRSIEVRSTRFSRCVTIKWCIPLLRH